MKRIICGLLSVCLMFSFFAFDTVAVSEEEIAPYVIDFTVTAFDDFSVQAANTRVSGLILTYGISIEKSGTSIVIKGKTVCGPEVVKCGFKNLIVERRKISSDSWSDYYDYGDVYSDATTSTLNTTLAVASGYQYRVTCKHYAKKSLLSTQSISNTSNIVTI